jgi:hypothetical protein
LLAFVRQQLLTNQTELSKYRVTSTKQIDKSTNVPQFCIDQLIKARLRAEHTGISDASPPDVEI